jgi:hypothetical protein
MRLRTLFVLLAVTPLAVVAACAKKDSTIAQLSGSEPQRISFGDPKLVQTSFSEKMANCWFSGPQPLLQGYRYETVLAHADPASGMVSSSRIRIFQEGAQGKEAFEVAFHPYNDNTLISTRNLTMPSDLAKRLKHDIETWIFGRKDCGERQA